MVAKNERIALTIADERVSFVVKSVIAAIDSETLALVIPPIILLMRNITNILDTDQVRYEINVPV